MHDLYHAGAIARVPIQHFHPVRHGRVLQGERVRRQQHVNGRPGRAQVWERVAVLPRPQLASGHGRRLERDDRMVN